MDPRSPHRSCGGIGVIKSEGERERERQTTKRPYAHPWQLQMLMRMTMMKMRMILRISQREALSPNLLNLLSADVHFTQSFLLIGSSTIEILRARRPVPACGKGAGMRRVRESSN